VAYADARCGVIEDCYAVADLIYPDGIECRDRMKLECEGDFDLPDAVTTPEWVTTCAAAWTSNGCAGAFDSPAECIPPPGARDNGVACENHSQCANGWCEIADNEGCGVCAEPRGEGATCAGAERACAHGFICGEQDGLCHQARRVGEACSDVEPCWIDGYCNPISNQCEALRVEGQDCGVTIGACSQTAGLYCKESYGVCALFDWAMNAGDRCLAEASPTEHLVCAGDMFCSGADDAMTCTAAPGIGDACDASQPVAGHCPEPALCVDGKCTLPADIACD